MISTAQPSHFTDGRPRKSYEPHAYWARPDAGQETKPNPFTSTLECSYWVQREVSRPQLRETCSPCHGFFMASPCYGMHGLDCALWEHCIQTFFKFFCFAIFFNTALICRNYYFLFCFTSVLIILDKYWIYTNSDNNIQRNHLAHFCFCCLLAFKFVFALTHKYSWTQKKHFFSAWEVCS